MPVPCICEVCGASFSVDPYRIRAGKGKYCSKACMEQSRRTAVACICLGCSKTFSVIPALIRQGYGKYCSRTCYEQAKRVSCVCLACQETFTLPVSAINKGEGKYCSRACFNQHRLRPMAERFWSHVLKTEDDTCWLWQGHRTDRGYGAFNLDATHPVPAHRLAYELTFGIIIPGVWCLHHCDNPPCCNPRHLFLGTPGDNVQDMVRKGRAGPTQHPERMARGERHGTHTHPEKVPRGERSWNTTLTDDQVREMRRLRAVEKWELKRLAAHFGVSISTTGKICNRQVWQHVE